MAAIEAMGCGVGWVDGDLGHGRAYRFRSPGGHDFELYYDTRKYVPPEGERPALKNIAQRYHGRGVCPRRLDHVNLLAQDVAAARDFMVGALGARVTELIELDSGRLGGCWFTVNNKGYDTVFTEDHTRRAGGFHHLTYAMDQREDVLRAADIFLENGVHIETGPHKHAIQGSFFLYVWEPAGIRVEVANAGARLILRPDWKPVIWTEAERKKGQAWGLQDDRELPYPRHAAGRRVGRGPWPGRHSSSARTRRTSSGAAAARSRCMRRRAMRSPWSASPSASAARAPSSGSGRA